jgi:hypothetical protein
VQKIAIVMQSPCGEPEVWEFETQSEGARTAVYHDGDLWFHTAETSDQGLRQQIVQRLASAEAAEEASLAEAEMASGTWVEVNREARIAMTVDQLIQQTSEFSRRKAPNCRANLFRTEAKFGRWTFRVRCSESYSSPAGHLTRIQLDPEFEGESVAESDIFVSCSCPAWKYWGADYNSKTKGYLEGPQRSDGSPPDIRDPGRRNMICKHVASAGKMFRGFIFPLVYRERYRNYVDELKQKRSPIRQPGTPNTLAPTPAPRPTPTPARPLPTTEPTERGRRYVAPQPEEATGADVGTEEVTPEEN